jgi:hypothetical protein
MENQPNASENQGLPQDTQEAVKSFFKNDLKGMVTQFLSDPIEGTHAFFVNRNQHAYFQSLVLIGSVFVLYFIIPYLLMGDARSLMDLGDMFQLGMLPVVFMVVISLVSFVIKSVSGSATFRDELFTGALNAFPLTFFLIIVTIGVVFSDYNFLSYLNSLGRMMESLGVVVVFILYIFLMMVNILQQSLKASGTKDVLAYYLAPAAVLLAWYITLRFMDSMFD